MGAEIGLLRNRTAFPAVKVKSLTDLFSRSESRIQQGFFCPYRVTFARIFFIRSAVYGIMLQAVLIFELLYHIIGIESSERQG